MAKIEFETTTSTTADDHWSTEVQSATLRSAVVQDESGAIVVLEGELDLSTGPDLYAELERLLCSSPPSLTLDLSRLRFIDSSGVSVLHTTRQHALERGVAFRLHAPSPPVQRVLEITALWAHFDSTPRRFEDGAFQW